MKIIAKIYTDFPEKFGIPRQSCLVSEAKGKIIFEPEYRSNEAVRGLDEFDYIWLLWDFSLWERDKKEWSPTVRPPRLGGNKRIGVFATRSPNRPNPVGLSSVKLDKIEYTDNGPVLWVSGIDMANETPIYDIKPYLAYVDCHTDASNGFAEETVDYSLDVEISESLIDIIGTDKWNVVEKILSKDPRPSYQDDDRIYGMSYADMEIKFKVANNTVYVMDVLKTSRGL